jgi:ATP-dependent DNA helicase RecG
VIANGSINNSEVQKLLNTSKPTATRLLKQTEKWLEMKNVGRRGVEYYFKRGY